MLENHPLLIEKESYKVKYLNVLEYFSQKYSANDPWANQTLQLYIKKFLGTKNSHKYDNFNLQRNTKPVLATKFRPFKFFSYRYCLIIDCIFICAYGDKEKSEKIFSELSAVYHKRYQKKLRQVFDSLYDPTISTEGIEQIQYLKSCWDMNRKFITNEPIKVIITANMSAGKSTLLNALVGKKVNKTQNDACTAKIHKIKSLTNGLNGQIFAANEVDNTELFDGKVIIDISRVGSTETKSLIMGILIMRLSEHRMSTCNDMNIPLHHVTVLEEAHNILKRTSTEQNPEGSNVAGKSVEMLSNAIAEMRTYGEGFIIADQSPSAVDISAIRNTNTKIIMRLPDEQDRRLAGKSAGLRDNQLDEIAKLPKGVAVVYQNDWLEPVLCKIGKFRGEEHRYQREAQNCTTFSCNRATALIQNLLNKTAGERLDMNLSELSAWIIGMDIPSHTKISALKALRLNGSCTLGDISPVIYDLIYSPSVEKEAEEADSIEEWKNVLVYANNSALADLNEQDQNVAVECILREQIERFGKPSEYLDTWRKFLKREVM